MNRNFASILAFAATTAVAGLAAVASSAVYAETPTIDDTPFVSTRTRAEVRAEVLRQPESVTAAASEWTLQHNHAPQVASMLTREQVRAQYLAAREEVHALTSEDSGSSYFAARQMRDDDSGIRMAGSSR